MATNAFKGKIQSFTEDMNYNAIRLNETRQAHQLEKNEIKKRGLEIELEKLNRSIGYYHKAINTFKNAIEILEQEVGDVSFISQNL